MTWKAQTSQTVGERRHGILPSYYLILLDNDQVTANENWLNDSRELSLCLSAGTKLKTYGTCKKQITKKWLPLIHLEQQM